MHGKKYKAGQLITITTPIRRVLRIRRLMSSEYFTCDKCCINGYRIGSTLAGDDDKANKLLNKVCLGLCRELPAYHCFTTCHLNYNWKEWD